MIFQAHKGVSTENPENTMPAFEAAVRQGYGIIETDVSVTKDLKFVLLHDDTINRTARCENGNQLGNPVNLSDITYEDALRYDFGIGFSEKFRGTKIPLLEDVLKFSKQNGIKLKIDNKYQRFNSVQKEKFFELLAPYTDTASLACSSFEELRTASRLFPEMHFHYDGEVSCEMLEKISKIIAKEKLTVWIPHKNPNTSWVQVEFANERLSKLIKQYASLGVWILSDNSQLEDAKVLGADIIETNGQLKPILNSGLRVDMHTHGESSHDSVCKIEDMYKSQLKNGSAMFAVTDHFDTDSFTEYDIFTPVVSAAKTVSSLNKSHGNGNILKGIEISEGFWHPTKYEKARTLVDYDVIIGSVHLVRYKNMTAAYSKIDFSEVLSETISKYVSTYLDDIITMTDTTDFDILAHLTCPLRYINGKYKIGFDISVYKDKIEKILYRIIEKGIALEVNTSSYGILNDFMPSIEILQMYYDMGGYLITLGSDAHTAENASANFGEAIKQIKKIGFKNIYFYKKRNPYQITI